MSLITNKCFKRSGLLLCNALLLMNISERPYYDKSIITLLLIADRCIVATVAHYYYQYSYMYIWLFGRLFMEYS